MRPSTRLDSAVFQLTPTRTRCDLVVSANGKKEKIASGLLTPFLAHLKAAQDQMAKGGYSITLEPGRGIEADWFTKSTVERFVRFVSTPEVLERVYTVESEILQITEAIAFQNTNDLGAEDHQGKPVESLEGSSRPTSDSNEERAIVLYKPEAHPPEANRSIAQEGNSKVQLLKVLETRKTMLEKEQGMAFARAVAAGFDIDHMAPLISFAECFGALRLMDACKRFLELWKRKHETGQWLEMEAAAQVSMHSELSPESNGKATTETSTDKKPSMEHQSPQSHFPPHPMYAPWAVQSPNGAVPVFPVYPTQGMPYYNNYPINSPYFHPPYPSEDPRINAGQRIRQKRHSVDDDGSEDEIEFEEGSENRESQKKSSRSGKKQSGTVVIQNVNYITSKKQSSSGSESESVSGSDSDKEDGMRPSRLKENHAKRMDTLNSAGKEETENWNAFQDFLLRDADEDKGGSPDESMFSNEKEVQLRRRHNVLGDDPLSNGRLDDGKFMNGQIGIEMDNKKGAYRRSTNDDFMIHGRENPSSLDSLPVDRFEHGSNNLERSSSHNMDADSIVPFRGLSSDQVGRDERKAIDMDWVEKAKSNQAVTRVHYEPHDLSLMPDRGTERSSSGYDPALDYEMQVCAEDIASLDKKKNEDKQEGYMKLVNDGKKLTPDSSGKKKKTVGPIRKGKPSKLSPLDEARARAEKLRTYKADLLKLKKEKEEEEKKRLEHLKIERQKRIAARGGSSVPAQSSSASQQTQRKLPAKPSPSSQKQSKFSDLEPGSLSPLQRSIRPASLGSGDHQKVSKTGNKISKSVASLPESTKQRSSVTPDTKPSMARVRRLSEPKMRSVEPISKPKSTGPESKKISAIVNLDKTKAATLPGLKLRTSKEPDADKRMSIEKEMTEIVNDESAELKRNNDKNSHHNSGDDNTVIEKSVVTLESEKPSGQAAIHAPVSPIVIDGIKRLSIEHQKHAQPNPFEVTTVNAETESLKYSSVDAPEKLYQPPYARISSMEDPCTQNSEYGKAPTASVEVLTTSMEAVKVSSDSENLKLEKIPEALEKPHAKGSSSKGFKHLLKFGRKNHSSASSDHNAESDNSSVHGSDADVYGTYTASGEVHTLKNLISQDETPTANATPQKPSRSFSLLSPFRNKSSEKKLIT